MLIPVGHYFTIRKRAAAGRAPLASAKSKDS
jgi:hypothetical protein